MSLLQHSPGMVLNAFALLAVAPGIWLLHTTRSREQRETTHLNDLTERAPIDEPMHVMDVPTLHLIRQSYRIGAACLIVAVLLSWASTRL